MLVADKHVEAHVQCNPHRHFHGPVEKLGHLWPSLPFLSYGVWFAWVSIAYGGAGWLSDSEVDGHSLSLLYLISTMSFAVACFATTILPHKAKVMFDHKVFTITSGAVASLGALLVILAGPYYVGATGELAEAVLFKSGGVLTGVGTALLSVRIGIIYSALPPRRALLYAALSQFVVAFVYFAVTCSPEWAFIPGGPTASGMGAFILLPLFAALLVKVPSSALDNEPDPVDYQGGFRRLPASFMRLCVFAFLITLVATMVRANIVESAQPAETLSNTNLQMLVRVLVGAVFIYLAVYAADSRFNFGRLHALLAFWIAVVVTVTGVIGANSFGAIVLVTAADNVLEISIWRLLAFIVYQRRLSPPYVFGLGRGLYSLGTTIGWAVGMYAIPVLVSYVGFIYIALASAFIVLVASLFVFGERNFSALFAPHSDEEKPFEKLVNIEVGHMEPPAGEDARQRGRFKVAVEQIASEYQLSPRETDVFRYLAMGHGGDYIAEKLCVSWNTVRTHTHHVYVKLDVHSREELIELVDTQRRAVREGE